MARGYRLHHPEIASFDGSFIEPAVLAALEADSPDARRQLVREVQPGVFGLPLLSSKLCEALADELRKHEYSLERRKLVLRQPSSIKPSGPLSLEDLGLDALAEELLHRVIAPFSSLLFAPFGGDSLDYLHAFLSSSEPRGKEPEIFATDDSEVTVNVCLTEDFEGGEERFGELCCDVHTGKQAASGAVTVAQSLGVALLHAGCHRHLAAPPRRGRRSNLVLLCRSSRRRRQPVQLACGDWCRGYLRAG